MVLIAVYLNDLQNPFFPPSSNSFILQIVLVTLQPTDYLTVLFCECNSDTSAWIFFKFYENKVFVYFYISLQNAI